MKRRDFLSKSLIAATGIAGMTSMQSVRAASLRDKLPDSMIHPGLDFTNYGKPSEYESGVIRWIVSSQDTPGNGASWTPLHQLSGSITPNGLHFERHHNGVPDINPDEHEFVISGLVANPLKFSVTNLLEYPYQSRVCFIECGGNSNSMFNSKPSQSAVGHVHGLVSNAEWTGVPLKWLLEQAEPSSDAKWAIAIGADAGAFQVSIPLSKLLDDAMIALYQNGERLRPENGYPMRLLLPGWEGVTSVKWLRQLKLSSEPAQTRDETAKYTELHPDGTSTQFSFGIGPKSLITSPSPGMRLQKESTVHQIEGLAWSGAGRVTQVEVSLDNGETWRQAHLLNEPQPKAMVRFASSFEWHAQSMTIMSRTIDEFGNQQPSRESILRESGEDSYYHFNGIVKWQIDSNGYVHHVY